MYYTHIPSSDRTIHLLISFVSFVLSVFLLYLSIYVYVTHVCKKKINEIKKGEQVRICFFIFLPSLTTVCLITSLMVYAVKKTLKIWDKNDVITE